jgi:hypothetical protein
MINQGFAIHAIYNLEKQFDFMHHIDYCSVSLFKAEK